MVTVKPLFFNSSGDLERISGANYISVSSLGAGDVNDTKFSYLNSLTGNVQTQLNNKENLITKGNFSEINSSVLTITGGASSIIGSGLTVEVKQSGTTQSGFLSSTDWNTFNSKQATITGAASSIVSSNLNSSIVAVSDANGKITSSSISATKLGYLTDVTSNIQSQIDGKSSTSHNHSLAGLSEKSYSSLTDKPSLGTISSQNSNSVSITGGSLSGLSSLSTVGGITQANDSVTESFLTARLSGGVADFGGLVIDQNSTYRLRLTAQATSGISGSGYLKYEKASDKSLGTGNFYFQGFSNLYHGVSKIWTEANDGSSSGLDADLLDGQQGTYYTHSNLTYLDSVNQNLGTSNSPQFTDLTLSGDLENTNSSVSIDVKNFAYGVIIAPKSETVNRTGLYLVTQADYSHIYSYNQSQTRYANLSINNGKLYLDTINSRLGINNISPAYSLDVTGNINSSTGYLVGGTTRISSTGVGTFISGTKIDSSTNSNLQINAGVDYYPQLDFYENNALKSFIRYNSTADTFVAYNNVGNNYLSLSDSGVVYLVSTNSQDIQLIASGKITGKGSRLLQDYKSGTITASAGWYRIAETALNVGNNSALFKITSNSSGRHCSILLRANVHYNAGSNSADINQVSFGEFASGQPFTKARLVYRDGVYTNEYAYLEIYMPSSVATATQVELINSTGWVLDDIPTAGSIPANYTSKEITFRKGFVTTGNYSIGNDVVIDSTKVGYFNNGTIISGTGSTYLYVNGGTSSSFSALVFETEGNQKITEAYYGATSLFEIKNNTGNNYFRLNDSGENILYSTNSQNITLTPSANVNISSGALQLSGTTRISAAGLGTFIHGTKVENAGTPWFYINSTDGAGNPAVSFQKAGVAKSYLQYSTDLAISIGSNVGGNYLSILETGDIICNIASGNYFRPVTTNISSLGSSSIKWKDAYLSGILNSSKIYKDSWMKCNSSTTEMWFNDMCQYSATSTKTGALILNTGIPYSNSDMVLIEFLGYLYTTGQAILDIKVGGYAYGASSGFLQNGYINNGNVRYSVRAAKKISDGTLAIIIGDLTCDGAASTFSYPNINVKSALLGYVSNISYADNWSMTVTDYTLQADYDAIYSNTTVVTEAGGYLLKANVDNTYDIGTTALRYKSGYFKNVNCVGTTQDVNVFEYSSSGTNIVGYPLSISHRTSSNMVDSFGAGITFRIVDSANVYNYAGYLMFQRNGADNTSKATFYNYSSGSANHFLVADTTTISFRNTLPITNNTFDLGSSSFKWKDAYFAGTVSANKVSFLTQYDDVQVPVTSTKLGGSKDPSWEKVKDNGSGSQGVFSYHFSNTTEQEVYFVMQLPHGYKEASNIVAHIHWSPINANSGNVIFGIEYTWCNVDGTFGNTTLSEVTVAAGGTAYKHKVTDIVTITGTGKTISSLVLARFYRKAADALDTYESKVAVFDVDFHIQKDTLGSLSVTTKT